MGHNAFEDCGCEEVGHNQAASNRFEDKIKFLLKKKKAMGDSSRAGAKAVGRKSDCDKQDFLKHLLFPDYLLSLSMSIL